MPGASMGNGCWVAPSSPPAGTLTAGVEALLAWADGSGSLPWASDGVPTSFGVLTADAGGVAVRGVSGAGVGVGAALGWVEGASCGAGVLEGRSAGEGRWGPLEPDPGGGRRTAAFGLKADFLFSILSGRGHSLPRSGRRSLSRGPRARAHCLEGEGLHCWPDASGRRRSERLGPGGRLCRVAAREYCWRVLFCPRAGGWWLVVGGMWNVECE